MIFKQRGYKDGTHASGVYSVRTVGMRNLRDVVCTLEVAPAIEKLSVNGDGGPRNHVIQARETCCVDVGAISPGVNPICKVRENCY